MVFLLISFLELRHTAVNNYATPNPYFDIKIVIYFASLHQDLLPEILANLSNILSSVANNMKANDERPISQGVYNLLYGTIELLMVSAEASVVTGKSETLSADQLKVPCGRFAWLNLFNFIS